MIAPKSLSRIEIIAAIISFALILLTGLLRQIAIRAGGDVGTIQTITAGAVLLLFLVFGLSSVGLMLHAFIALQKKAGNAAAPMVSFLAQHEAPVTFALWAFLGLGALLALPFAFRDLLADAGVPAPIGKSKGTLVANIGMTLDEIRRRSTLKIKDLTPMPGGSGMAYEEMVFDFQIAGSGLTFPQSSYYWIETAKGGDPRVVRLNIGITPRQMKKPELNAFQRRAQEQVFADGWMPGHKIARSEETVRLWGGERTAGDGRYWARGDTLLSFEPNRIGVALTTDPPDSGEFILYIALRPKSEEPDLVYERSAWPN